MCRITHDVLECGCILKFKMDRCQEARFADLTGFDRSCELLTFEIAHAGTCRPRCPYASAQISRSPPDSQPMNPAHALSRRYFPNSSSDEAAENADQPEEETPGVPDFSPDLPGRSSMHDEEALNSSARVARRPARGDSLPFRGSRSTVPPRVLDYDTPVQLEPFPDEAVRAFAEFDSLQPEAGQMLYAFWEGCRVPDVRHPPGLQVGTQDLERRRRRNAGADQQHEEEDADDET